uniref:glycoprotein-N-acetylgalactosamine 3-beta-galactosyltransferase 1-like isoform X2 n=1 Tax=Ciona intestinalis TaxID=7719 RepID=UPI00089DC4C9|nr:glycoprotein-N-acetylgalactosamine 3-beta-galactosyltransferase 1-like isoform X2 [Ciona intestinalis]|eukprot:XP_018669470.1 glycoprotein-N-acetylgalactosamine 3-beta-galactosyltransferase 1-like isoform X2 [Ciona intestinalis]
MRRNEFLLFICGLVIGGLIAVTLHKYSDTSLRPVRSPEVSQYNFVSTRTETTTCESTAKNISNVRVLCWVMTSPMTLFTKAVHVRDTWGRRCDKILFMSSEDNEKLPAIGLGVKEGREHLYDKTAAAFQYIWTHHKDEADWFLKADDDTYVIIENLKLLLKDHDPYLPMYFGRKFTPMVKQGYMSGGAGYVLSKAALSRFDRATRTQRCIPLDSNEDLEIGRCMQHIGVKTMDSRDPEKKETFFPFSPALHILPGNIPKDSWYWKYIAHPNPSGPGCCSKHMISFHYVQPDMMHIIHHFIYRMEAYGVKAQSYV